MVYWWVNQNQTAKHEISGGYMWSPKRNQNGGFNQFYQNMRLVDAGDIVFSFYNQKIQHLGIVQRPAVSGNKPSDFGLTGDYWNNEGWFVPVEWSKAPVAIRPRDIIDELRPHIPAKYSPLHHSGNGLQNVYLAAVPEPMAEVLLAHLMEWAVGILDMAKSSGVDDGAVRNLDDTIERTIQNNTDISETERQAVISARRGQGRFRLNVEAIELGCRVTRVTDPRLLRASHIKPWRSCASNHERLDGHNGLLLAPHIDHLFDRGYISFSDEGLMLVSSKIGEDQLARLGVRSIPPLTVGSFNQQQRAELAFHREIVFLRVVQAVPV
jgi:putative restriction endonuclease